MTIKINKKQVIVALDLDSFEETEEILKFLDPNLYRVKTVSYTHLTLPTSYAV